MIGTIYGDIAAWTFERDPKMFKRQLVPTNGNRAELSVYGNEYMKASDYLNGNNSLYIATEPLIFSNQYYGKWLMWQIAAAWLDKTADSIPEFGGIHQIIDEVGKAVYSIIRLLRQGSSKREAYDSVPDLGRRARKTKWRDNSSDPGVDVCLIRAWDSFHHGYDFTSTLANAIKWDGDKHLICCIAAAFADAMYGCMYSHLKGGKSLNIDCSNIKTDDYSPNLFGLMLHTSSYCRSFFPKNESLTNVNKHTWKKIHVPYNKCLDEDAKRKLLKAGPTGWDNRYGLYLDDGWIYCYRSGIILLRFRMESCGHDYRLVDFQLSDERDIHDAINGLYDALHSTCGISEGLDVSILKFEEGLKFCHYYHGEEENPASYNEKEQVYWWIEQQYFTDRYIDQAKRWEKDARTICKKDPQVMDFMKNKKIPIEVKGMIAFAIQDFLYHSAYADTVYGFANHLQTTFYLN